MSLSVRECPRVWVSHTPEPETFSLMVVHTHTLHRTVCRAAFPSVSSHKFSFLSLFFCLHVCCPHFTCVVFCWVVLCRFMIRNDSRSDVCSHHHQSRRLC